MVEDLEVYSAGLEGRKVADGLDQILGLLVIQER